MDDVNALEGALESRGDFLHEIVENLRRMHCRSGVDLFPAAHREGLRAESELRSTSSGAVTVAQADMASAKTTGSRGLRPYYSVELTATVDKSFVPRCSLPPKVLSAPRRPLRHGSDQCGAGQQAWDFVGTSPQPSPPSARGFTIHDNAARTWTSVGRRQPMSAA